MTVLEKIRDKESGSWKSCLRNYNNNNNNNNNDDDDDEN